MSANQTSALIPFQVLFFKDSNGVNTCPINGEFPGVGIGTYGVMCSGHGDCVDGKCVCEFGWTGVSDIYDLHGLDCHSPRIFEQVIWSLAIVAWVRLTYINVVALKYQWGLLEARNNAARSQGESLSWFAFSPTRYLVINLVICCPSFLVLGILKASTTQAVGVDIPVSIFLGFAGSFSFLLAMGPDLDVLQVFVSGISKSKEVQAVVNKAKMIFKISTAIYFISNWFMIFLPIALPDTFNGTSGTPRASVLIARNGTSALQFFVSFSVTYFISKQATMVITSASNKAKSTSDEKVKEILKELDKEVRGMMTKTFIGSVIYSIFSIPQLWGYVTYILAFMIIILSGRSHTAHWYLPKGRIDEIDRRFGSKSGSSTTPSSNNVAGLHMSRTIKISEINKHASIEPMQE